MAYFRCGGNGSVITIDGTEYDVDVTLTSKKVVSGIARSGINTMCLTSKTNSTITLDNCHFILGAPRGGTSTGGTARCACYNVYKKSNSYLISKTAPSSSNIASISLVKYDENTAFAIAANSKFSSSATEFYKLSVSGSGTNKSVVATKLTSPPTTDSRFQQLMTCCGNYIYLLGGYGNWQSFRYNVSSNTWENISSVITNMGNGAYNAFADTSKNIVYWIDSTKLYSLNVSSMTQSIVKSSLSSSYSYIKPDAGNGDSLIVKCSNGKCVYAYSGTVYELDISTDTLTTKLSVVGTINVNCNVVGHMLNYGDVIGSLYTTGSDLFTVEKLYAKS